MKIVDIGIVILNEDIHDKSVRRLINWLKGSFQALDKKYVSF